MPKTIYSCAFFLTTSLNCYATHTDYQDLDSAYKSFNLRDNAHLTNPDGRKINYCEPYIIQTFRDDSINEYFTFSKYLGFDFLHSTHKISEAKVVIIVPINPLFVCYGSDLFFKSPLTEVHSKEVKSNGGVYLKFLDPNYPNFIYLTKTLFNYYYLGSRKYVINIADFQTKSDFSFNPFNSGWAKELRGDSSIKKILFLPLVN